MSKQIIEKLKNFDTWRILHSECKIILEHLQGFYYIVGAMQGKWD